MINDSDVGSELQILVAIISFRQRVCQWKSDVGLKGSS